MRRHFHWIYQQYLSGVQRGSEVWRDSVWLVGRQHEKVCELGLRSSFSSVLRVLFLSVTQPLARAHSVGLTQHCSGRAPRITRCLRSERRNGERSDITAWSAVSPKTHGSRRKKTTAALCVERERETVYSLVWEPAGNIYFTTIDTREIFWVGAQKRGSGASGLLTFC